MSWIVLIPPDEVGGAVQAVKLDDTGLPYLGGGKPFEFDSYNVARQHARRFRCGIVVELNAPLRLATPHAEED